MKPSYSVIFITAANNLIIFICIEKEQRYDYTWDSISYRISFYLKIRLKKNINWDIKYKYII